MRRVVRKLISIGAMSKVATKYKRKVGVTKYVSKAKGEIYFKIKFMLEFIISLNEIIFLIFAGES
jgi:hypothetical protein